MLCKGKKERFFSIPVSKFTTQTVTSTFNDLLLFFTKVSFAEKTDLILFKFLNQVFQKFQKLFIEKFLMKKNWESQD